MTWAVTPGQPHGGPLPLPSIDALDTQHFYAGDTVTITGNGFTPNSQILLQPQNRVIGFTNPTTTTTVDVMLPYDLPNRKHTLSIYNGNLSNEVDLFIVRDVSIMATSLVTTVTTVFIH